MTVSAYQATIGIECHVQLNTNTKLFAAVGNDARNAPPNSLVSHICFGLPGALPVLNEKVVEYAARMAFAFGTTPQKYSFFERKHYFYPDLPKGYQITQLSHPIVVGGHVDIMVGDRKQRVKLNRVQIEEDAGKNTHPSGQDYSLVDLNRAGTPLLEIVSEPDIDSPEAAKAYAHELYLLVRYAGVSDADLYHGNMRFDINVSVSDNPARLGTRTETKNLNSFRSVEKAAEYEIKRQTEILKRGDTVTQETRGWDDAKQKTFSQRGKEEAHDYRYMPDPDIPPLELSQDFINAIKDSMPVLPGEWRQRLTTLELGGSQTDILLEAEIEDRQTSYLALIENNLKNNPKAKFLANYFVNVEIPLRREEKADRHLKDAAREEMYDAVYDMLSANKLSSTNAKSLLAQLLGDGISPENLEKYAKEQGYVQVSDEAEIAKIVKEIIAEYPEAANDVRAGQTKAIGFLVGQVMKKSLGKANPPMVQTAIKKQLGV